MRPQILQGKLLQMAATYKKPKDTRLMFQGKTLRLDELSNNIVELCFDNGRGSVNKFDQTTLAELETALQRLKGTPSVRGLILTSAKSGFVVGADIGEFSAMFSLSEGDFLSNAAHVNGIFSDIEELPFPTIAAINGFALGGGFEICMACDSRIMATSASVGLPEVTLGIMPGWGGTVRLPRLVGLSAALQWITSGRPNSALQALSVGAVDKVVEQVILKQVAIEHLQMMHENFDELLVSRQQKQKPLSIADSDLSELIAITTNRLMSKQGANYPAGTMIVKLLQSSVLEHRDAALEMENRAFYQVTQTPSARALSGVFLGEQFVLKQAKQKQQLASKRNSALSKAAVIGAGIMGGGIAYQNALKDVPVIMKDIRQEALDLGIEEANSLLSKAVIRGKLDEEGAKTILARITPTLHDQLLTDADVLIEAVVEIESIKAQVLSSLESQLGPTDQPVVIASNTSTISITSLAKSLRRPESFVGMHFFNPVHAMPLVEIIRGEKTSDETVAKICAYALKLGKKPIVVNDCPGFLVNRVLFAALMGMEMLISEGVDFRQIDQVMESWGLPMGPAYLADVIGLDTVNHCYSVLCEGLPERFNRLAGGYPSGILLGMERIGQKNGRGYYAYPANERGRPIKTNDSAVSEIFAQRQGVSQVLDETEIIDRIMLPMGLEMVRCLEESVVATPIEADMALIYGIGFPRFRGGICRWMDEVGLKTVCEHADRYAHVSPLYNAPQSLRQRAAAGDTLY